MSENLMNFLSAVSKDEALSAKIGAEADKSVIIAIAKDMGYDLTEADFKPQTQELDDDDLDTVVGGANAVNCSCALGGGGSKDQNDKTCACVAAGFGYCKDGSQRCFCALAGFGYDY